MERIYNVQQENYSDKYRWNGFVGVHKQGLGRNISPSAIHQSRTLHCPAHCAGIPSSLDP
jgi:hypothetical protein